jgi:curved DNA-binding protein
MGRLARPDLYEILQVSRRAHPVIVTKAYRLLAALYHPDNKRTGNTERFQEVIEAAKVLTDPVLRAAYDRELFDADAVQVSRGNGLPAEVAVARPLGSRDERTQRQTLLQALYHMRRNRPSQPDLSLIVVLELLDCSVEDAQFTLWYLRGKKLIETTDAGWAITVAGVDLVESSGLADALGVPGSEMLALSERTNAIEGL